VDEGGPNSCLLFGNDIGGFLYKLSGVALVAVFSFPFAAIAFIGALIVSLGAWLWSLIGNKKN
jgi:hypothetical protein